MARSSETCLPNWNTAIKSPIAVTWARSCHCDNDNRNDQTNSNCLATFVTHTQPFQISIISADIYLCWIKTCKQSWFLKHLNSNIKHLLCLCQQSFVTHIFFLFSICHVVYLIRVWKDIACTGLSETERSDLSRNSINLVRDCRRKDWEILQI